MQVRRAEAADAPAIECLYRLLVPGDSNIRVVAERVAALRDDEHNQLLVLELEGEIRGTAFLSIALDVMYSGFPFGTVENVIIAPEQRGRGLGRVLMGAVEAQARAAHCTKLMLLSALSRHDAHAFFERVGFDGVKKRAFVRYLNRKS